MRILLLSFYYPPDLSAGSFRSAALVRALTDVIPSDTSLDVWTSMPNRYHSYQQAAPDKEQNGAVSIRRFQLPSHQSGMRDQARAFSSFARQIWRAQRAESFDLVIATSSRLFTAWLGARIARHQGARLYLDIRDIFTETMQNLLARPIGSMLHPVLDRVEAYTMRSADRINLVSAGFLPYFQQRYPGMAFSNYPNGIDPDFLTNNFPANSVGHQPKRILYAGNMGQGQGLHRIVPELAQRLGDSHEFILIGEGGALNVLKQRLSALGVNNVDIRPPVPREQLIQYYAEADYLFLHLNDFPAFRRVLPSKIFEYAATGRPILAGVAGYAAEFLQSQVANAAVFPPCDPEGGERALRSLNTGSTDRSRFIAQFKRDNLMADMARDILSVL